MNKIKELRLHKLMTQAEASQAIGVTRAAWNNYEKGIRIPRDEIKVKIAELLGASVQFIFFD